MNLIEDLLEIDIWVDVRQSPCFRVPQQINSMLPDGDGAPWCGLVVRGDDAIWQILKRKGRLIKCWKSHLRYELLLEQVNSLSVFAGTADGVRQ